MAEHPVRVALAGDEQAHRLLMEHLADAATPDVGDLERRRQFVGDGRGGAFLNTGKRPPAEAAPSGRPLYRSQRVGARPLGHAAVFVESVKALAPWSDVALVLVDEDGVAGRAKAAAEARAHLAELGLPTAILGVCDPIAEAWLIALIAPSRPRPAGALAKALTFDPSRHPEQLNSRAGSPRHAKRVLHYLLDHGRRELATYPEDTPKASETGPALQCSDIEHQHIARLRGCGLAAFFEELRRDYALRVLARSASP